MENSTLMRFDLTAPDMTPLVHMWLKAVERLRRELLTHIKDRQRRKKIKEGQRRSKKGKMNS